MIHAANLLGSLLDARRTRHQVSDAPENAPMPPKKTELPLERCELAADEKTGAMLDLGDPVREGRFERHEIRVCVEVSVGGGFNEVEAN